MTVVKSDYWVTIGLHFALELMGWDPQQTYSMCFDWMDQVFHDVFPAFLGLIN